jgi:ribosomal protein L17
MKELLPKKLRGLADPVIDLQVAQTKGKARVAKKATRKASAYSKKYGRAFKRLAPKYKKKNGSWKKDGFKRCQKAAHRAVK